MNIPAKYKTTALQAYFHLVRLGWLNIATVILCLISALGLLWIVPMGDQRISQYQEDIEHLQKLNKAKKHSDSGSLYKTPQERIKHFFSVLGEKRYPEQSVRTILALAEKSGIRVYKADYQTGYAPNGPYHTYQIILPVKGAYQDIRQFCEKVLLAIPFASLDEMRFRRDSVAERTLETQLRFTLYLNDSPTESNLTYSPLTQPKG